MFDQSLCEISRGLLWELLFMNCNKKSHFDGVTPPRRVKDLVMSLFARSRRWSGRWEAKLDRFSEEGGSCSGEGWEQKKKRECWKDE